MLLFYWNFCCFHQLYDHLIKFHHEKLRMNGYHEFYRATSIHKGVPLHTVSLWNTVILGIQTVLQHEYGSKFFDHCTQHVFSPTNYIVAFCALETVVLIGVHSWYITRVAHFNKATLPPDAYRGLSESLSSVSLYGVLWFMQLNSKVSWWEEQLKSIAIIIRLVLLHEILRPTICWRNKPISSTTLKITTTNLIKNWWHSMLNFVHPAEVYHKIRLKFIFSLN